MALAVVLLAGCAPTTPALSDTALPEPEVSATQSPTPPAPAIDLADPSSWIIDFSGVGPLTIGGSLAEQRQSMTAFTDSSGPECPVGMFDLIDSPVIWVHPGNDDSIDVIALGVKVFRPQIGDVSAGSPKTAEGIGVGATVDALRAAYPTLEETGSISAWTHFAVAGSPNWIVFSVLDGVVDAITVGPNSVPPSEFCG